MLLSFVSMSAYLRTKTISHIMRIWLPKILGLIICLFGHCIIFIVSSDSSLRTRKSNASKKRFPISSKESWIFFKLTSSIFLRCGFFEYLFLEDAKIAELKDEIEALNQYVTDHGLSEHTDKYVSRSKVFSILRIIFFGNYYCFTEIMYKHHFL